MPSLFASDRSTGCLKSVGSKFQHSGPQRRYGNRLLVLWRKVALQGIGNDGRELEPFGGGMNRQAPGQVRFEVDRLLPKFPPIGPGDGAAAWPAGRLGGCGKFHGDALPVVGWAPTETPRGLQVLKMIASVWLVLIFAIPSSAEAACPPGQDLRTDRSSNGQVEARGCVGRGADGNYRRQGPWTYWYENGQKRAEGAYKDDKQEGPWTYW